MSRRSGKRMDRRLQAGIRDLQQCARAKRCPAEQGAGVEQEQALIGLSQGMVGMAEQHGICRQLPPPGGKEGKSRLDAVAVAVTDQDSLSLPFADQLPGRGEPTSHSFRPAGPVPIRRPRHQASASSHNV